MFHSTEILSGLLLCCAVVCSGCVSYHDADSGKTLFESAKESRWNRSLPTSAFGSPLTRTYAIAAPELLDNINAVIVDRGDQVVFRNDESNMLGVRTTSLDPEADATQHWYNVLLVPAPGGTTVLISPHETTVQSIVFARPVMFRGFRVAESKKVTIQREIFSSLDVRLKGDKR